MQEFDHVTIEVLNLSKRTYHALARAGVLTIGNLRQFYINRGKEKIRTIGENSLREISKAFEELPNNPAILAHMKKAPIQLSFHEDKWVGKTSQSSIDVLSLPPATRGMLKKHGIKTIDDLRKAPDSLLLNISLIGAKKLAEIKRILLDFADDPTVLVVNEHITLVEKKTITWAQIVEDYFRNEKDVYSYILISRFGYKPKTLEEIATELGVVKYPFYIPKINRQNQAF